MEWLRDRPGLRDALKLSGDGTLVDAPLRDAHRQRVEGLGVVLESHAVHIEEDLRGEQPRPFVAVDEGGWFETMWNRYAAAIANRPSYA